MIKDSAQEQQKKDIKPTDKILENRQQLLNHNHQKNINCMNIFGNKVFLGTKLSKMYIYEYDPKEKALGNKKIIIPHCQSVSYIAVSMRYFITVPEAQDQSNASVWDMKTLNFMTSLSGHMSQISGIIFLSDQNRVATSSWDGTIKIWDISNILEVQSFQVAADYPVLTIEEYQRQYLIYGGDDCYITVYNWKKKQQITKCFGHAGSVSAIYPLKNYFISCGGDQMIKLWQLSLQSIQTQQKMKQESHNQVQMNEIPVEHQIQIQKYQLNNTNSYKKYYDSAIFIQIINQQTFFFIDRHGSRFILQRNNNSFNISSQSNQFKYYDSITGIGLPSKENLMIATAKGDLYIYDIKECFLDESIIEKKKQNKFMIEQ